MRMLRSLFGLSILVISVSVALADAPIEGREGRAELRFLEGMMDHHQMALDMANDCLTNASSDTTKTLCQTIIDAQTAEIATMKEWTLAWYNVDYSPMSMMDMEMGMMEMGGMEGMPAMDPVMMMGMMAGLNRLEGVDYDIAWLESMIDHHDDAIHMSERLLERIPEGVGHADLFALANQIIADQTAEIEQMEALLVEYAG